MDLVDDEGIGREDVAILEPAPRDARRDDDDVPRRRFRRRLALAIDDADLELRLQDLFGNRPDRQRFPSARSGDDAEASAAARELADASTMFPLEERLDVETERELDRFAGGARWRDDDHSPRGRLELHECIAI